MLIFINVATDFTLLEKSSQPHLVCLCLSCCVRRNRYTPIRGEPSLAKASRVGTKSAWHVDWVTTKKDVCFKFLRSALPCPALLFSALCPALPSPVSIGPIERFSIVRAGATYVRHPDEGAVRPLRAGLHGQDESVKAWGAQLGRLCWYSTAASGSTRLLGGPFAGLCLDSPMDRCGW